MATALLQNYFQKSLIRCPRTCRTLVHRLTFRNVRCSSTRLWHSQISVQVPKGTHKCNKVKEAVRLRRYFRTSSAHHTEVVSFLLADIGEGIKEAQLTEWFVKVGDTVEQFQPICEVKSDKATAEITSRYEGTIVKLHHEVDDYAQVGQPLVDIQVAGDGQSTENQEDIVDQSEASSQDVRISPAVRKLAAEHNIQLSSIVGSGKNGQILKEDVLKYTSGSSGAGDSSDDTSDSDTEESADTRRSLATPAVRKLARDKNVMLDKVPGSGQDGRVLKEDIMAYLAYWDNTLQDAATTSPIKTQPQTSPTKTLPTTTTPTTTAPQVVTEDRTEMIRGVRKAMVKSMTMSQQIPHFGYSDEVDVTMLVKLRRQLQSVAQQRGSKFSYMPVFIKAASLALLQYPILNSIIDENCEHITYKASHNIGIAMDTRDGLIVPNIKDVKKLSIFELAEELTRLQNLAESNKFSTQDLSGGTFTFSNIGSIGGTYMRPVILFPQVAIGSIGRMQVVPRFDDNDHVTKASVLHVTWSADHRIIDGATMARFSNLWKTYVENPSMMILDLK